MGQAAAFPDTGPDRIADLVREAEYLALRDPAQGTLLGRRAVAAAVEVGDEILSARASMALAENLCETNGHEEALGLLIGTLATFERHGEVLGAARTRMLLGRLRNYVGDPASAVEILHPALADLRAHGEHTIEVYVLNEIANSEALLGHTASAVAKYEEAEQRFVEQGNLLWAAYVAQNQASSYTDLAKLTSGHERIELCTRALSIFAQVRTSAAAVESPLLGVYCGIGEGNAHQLIGDVDAARAAYSETIRCGLAVNAERVVVGAQIYLAEAEMLGGNAELAVAQLTMFAASLQRQNWNDDLALCLERLAAAHAALGNYKVAFETQLRFHAVDAQVHCHQFIHHGLPSGDQVRDQARDQAAQ